MEISHFLTLSAAHTTLYYLLVAFLLLGVAQAVVVGSLFFTKKSGDRRANACYGSLLVAFGLTLLHYVLVLTEVYQAYPQLKFLPLYFTLAFPTQLFYYVKLSLYPQYRMRWTDAKHFVLPVGQLLFFILMFWQPVAEKALLDRRFFNPFYGALEQLLYLGSFFSYTYFAYRYVQHRRRTTKQVGAGRLVDYLNTFLQVLFVLFSIHAAFVLIDYLSYEYFAVNLRSNKAFSGLGILSFAAILFWLGMYGFQVLIWGRKLFFQRAAPQ